ncbi:MAG: hypothetical protein ACHREM_12900 [Polyangiales bacterium]
MAGTWNYLRNQPTFAASTMLLLTDGSAMVQEYYSKNWWKLVPDATGSYVNGTWRQLASMNHSRLYYASAVLADGRVLVAGGEYCDGTQSDSNTVEIYDPLTNAWTVLAAPSKPGSNPPAAWDKIGDAPCCVLPDGRLLLGSIDTTATAFFDPRTNAWSNGPTKGDVSSEETWTLLPDGSVLSPQCTNHPNVEKFVEGQNGWVSAGSAVDDLVQATSIEIGPALLLPTGLVFAIGATGANGIYKPPAQPNQPGVWSAASSFPKDATNKLLEAKDAPAVLLPNGRVLCCAGPNSDADPSNYPSPTSFFEFDGQTLTAVNAPTNASGPPFDGRLLLLPTGEALFASGDTTIAIYQPDGSPSASWAPTVTRVAGALTIGSSYPLEGTQLNGLSQASAYGDDCSCATNYPLVRLKNIASGHVWYARTSGHSTMGVATGSRLVTTNFVVPVTEEGPTELMAVANGIPSTPVIVEVIAAFTEDLIPITAANVRAQWTGSSWKVTDGKSWLLDFGANQANAQRAAAVIKFYGFDQMGFVGRPATAQTPAMTYYLVRGAAPKGPMAGEDAIAFNPTTLAIVQNGPDWIVDAGQSALVDMGVSHANALTAERVLRKYGFTEQCFVGRPHAPMTYWRR